MLRHFIFTVFLCLGLSTYSQIEITNASLHDSSIKELYRGVNNLIVLEGKIDLACIRLVTTNSISKKTKEGYFNIQPYNNHVEVDSLSIYVGDELLLSEVFQMKKISEPILHFGNRMDTHYTIEEILNEPVLHWLFPACNYKIEARIIAFRTTMVQANGEIINSIDQTDSQLSRDVRLTIGSLEPGDKVFFENIRGIVGQGCPRRLGSFQVTIW